MPKKWIANIIKIVYFISIIALFELFIETGFDYFSRKDGPFEIDCIGDIDFAEINEIMSTLEIFYWVPHKIDIQVISCEKIFISSFGAPISCIEILTHLFASDYPDILWQNCIHHIAIIHLWLFAFVIIAFLKVSS